MSIQTFPLNGIKYNADDESKIARFCQPSFVNLNYQTNTNTLTIGTNSGITKGGKYFLFTEPEVLTFPSNHSNTTTYHVYVAYTTEGSSTGGSSEVLMSTTFPEDGDYDTVFNSRFLQITINSGATDISDELKTYIEPIAYITTQNNFNLTTQDYVGMTKTLPSTDLNNVFQAGYYNASGTMTNKPANSGMLFVATRGSGNDISQTFHDEVNNVYTRYYDKIPTNGWSDWQKLGATNSRTLLYSSSVGDKMEGVVTLSEPYANFEKLEFEMRNFNETPIIYDVGTMPTGLETSHFNTVLYCDVASLDGVGSRYKVFKAGSEPNQIVGNSINSAGGQLAVYGIYGINRK